MNCSKCERPTVAAKDGLCRACRLLPYTEATRKYVWTPALDAALRRAYETGSKPALGQAVRELMRQTGWPRFAFQNRAAFLHLRVTRSRGWTPADLALLREMAGEASIEKIAKALGRTYLAVKNRLFLLGIEGRLSTGYSQNELAHLLGEHHNQIRRWVQRGWLRMNADGRIGDAAIRRFLWAHLDAVRFRKADESWLKTMLLPALGTDAHQVDAPREAYAVARELDCYRAGDDLAQRRAA